MSENLIYCTVCGEKNSKDANFCSSCGAAIKKGKGKKTQKTTSQSGRKQLNPTAIIYSVIGLVAVGVFLLYIAGVFDSPAITTNVSQQQFSQNNPHTGVDLSSLQKIRDLEEIVAANPNDNNSLLNLAHLLNDSGFYRKAIERYRQYLAKVPDIPNVLIDMGVCYYNLGEYEEALKAMKKGVEINPRHQIGLFNIGIVNSAKGNMEEAKQWWRKSIDVNPNADIAKKAMDLIKQN